MVLVCEEENIKATMEVPGKRHDQDSNKASAEDQSLYCEPCVSEGKYRQAHGYCQTCDHHLCKACYKVHKKPVPMRHHQLLNKLQMPVLSKTNSLPKCDECSITCSTHTGKMIEFFCITHRDVICGVCAVLDHKPCIVEYIPDISNDYNNSEEYKCLIKTLDESINSIDNFLTTAAACYNVTEKSNEEAVEEMRKYRVKINDYLDKKENEMIRKGQQLQKEDKHMFSNVNGDCKTMKSELMDIKAQLFKYDGESSNQLIVAKQAITHVSNLHDRINALRSKCEANTYTFDPDPSLDKALKLDTPFGRIVQNSMPLNIPSDKSMEKNESDTLSNAISPMEDINVKLNTDKKKCFISGAAMLSPSQMIVSDNNNKCVKLINLQSNTIASHLHLFPSPWDVACLPEKQAAITIPGQKQIQIICTKDNILTPARIIQVNGKCRGIDTNGQELFVSFLNPGKIEILDFHGNLLKSLVSDPDVNNMLNWPDYVAVSKEHDQDALYSSDLQKGTLIKFDLDGTFAKTCRHLGLSGPEGLTVAPNGRVIICSRWDHTVQIVSPTDRHIRILLKETDGIKWPHCLCYCSAANKLYVFCDDHSNKMKVFFLY